MKIIFFYAVCFLLSILVSLDTSPFLSFFFEFINYVKPPEDLTDSVTVRDVNKKLDNFFAGIRNAGVLIGGGYAIKTVVNAVPHQAGKVIVGSFGLGALFASSTFERYLRRRPSDKGANNFLDKSSIFPYQIPSDPSPDLVEACKWICPFSAESICFLSIILIIELFRRTFIQWVFDKQLVQNWFGKYIHYIPPWFNKQAAKSGETVQHIYVGFICFLLLTNISNLTLGLIILNNHYISCFNFAISLCLWCYLPICLLILEIFKFHIMRNLFGYKEPSKPIRFSYVGLFVLSIIVLISYVLSIMSEVLL